MQAFKRRRKRGNGGPYYLFEQGDEPSNHFVHDVVRGSVDTPPVARIEIEGAWLVAMDYTLGSDTRLIK